MIKPIKLIVNILVFITPLFYLTSFAQQNKKIICNYNDSVVGSYYSKVYLAENYLMQGKPDSALKYYTDARKVFGLYQLNDMRNVGLCLNNCSDTSVLKEWLRFGYYCAADSIGPEKYMELYHSFIPESLKLNLLEILQQTPKKEWTYIEEHEQISRILDTLFEIDQKFHAGKFLNPKDKAIILEQRKVDKRNLKIIMSCYKNFGDFSTNRFPESAKTQECLYVYSNA